LRLSVQLSGAKLTLSRHQPARERLNHEGNAEGNHRHTSVNTSFPGSQGARYAAKFPCVHRWCDCSSSWSFVDHGNCFTHAAVDANGCNRWNAIALSKSRNKNRAEAVVAHTEATCVSAAVGGRANGMHTAHAKARAATLMLHLQRSLSARICCCFAFALWRECLSPIAPHWVESLTQGLPQGIYPIG
jgi:hypothetical protein